MGNIRILKYALVLLAVIGPLAPAQNAIAMTAQQYFEDGNRLFRDDLYWAALLRYRQAAEEGLDSGILHYNTGVAHYKAKQHIRARNALLKAAQSPSLRVASHYNLGLNAFALGDNKEALRWFRRVRDQEQNQILQRYAVVAISRIRDLEAQPDEFDVRVAEATRARERKFADIEFRARVGFGYDDNVFRTPNQPYVDLASSAQPVVTPTVQSGAFMPVTLSAKFKINSLPYEGFYTAYRAIGRYYQDKELDNANEFALEASLGNEYERREGSRTRKVSSAFTIAKHDETYYDPDDGATRAANGVIVDNRMNYLRYGPELSLRQSHERLAVGMDFTGQLWDYDDPGVLPEYDHEYFLISAYAQYKLSATSLFRLTAETYSRRYGDRPSYDLDGAQRQGNPTVRYDYVAATLRARQRISDSIWFGVDVGRTERTDKYVGYNDYSRDDYELVIHWNPGRRFKMQVGGIYSLYDFSNAFAFNNPAASIKTEEKLDARISGQFRMTRGLSLVARARYRETSSNDTRIQYDRWEYILGVLWRQ